MFSPGSSFSLTTNSYTHTETHEIPVFDNFNCSGTEVRLLDCFHTISHLKSYQKVYMQCKLSKLKMICWSVCQVFLLWVIYSDLSNYESFSLLIAGQLNSQELYCIILTSRLGFQKPEQYLNVRNLVAAKTAESIKK